MTWWALGCLQSVIRLFLGPQWHPARIAVPAQKAPGRFAAELLPNTEFVPEAEHAWVEIPRRCLTSAVHRGSIARLKSSGAGEMDEPADDFVGSLRLVLQSYLADGIPNIDNAAQIARVSVRTLQRRLAEHGRSYSQLLDEARLGRAVPLLRDPGIRVIDVSLEVGYRDPSHFARAFRRVAGVSPREYRRLTLSAETA